LCALIFFLLPVSIAWAEPVTIPVLLHWEDQTPALAQLEIAPDRFTARLSFLYNGKVSTVQLPANNFPQLYSLIKKPAARWERATFWKNKPIVFPTRLDSLENVEVHYERIDGESHFNVLIPLVEKKYLEAQAASSMSNHESLPTISYTQKVPLEELVLRSPARRNFGDSILFFPDGRELRAVPGLWMGRDLWNRDLFAATDEYLRFHEGQEKLLRIYGSSPDMVASPSENALNRAMVENAAYKQLNPVTYREELWPWRAALIEPTLEPTKNVLQSLTRIGFHTSPCGALFRLSAPSGFDDQEN